MFKSTNELLQKLYAQLRAECGNWYEIFRAIHNDKFYEEATEAVLEETENFNGWDSGMEFIALHKEAELICKAYDCSQWQLVKDILLIEVGFDGAVKHYRSVKE